MKAESARQIQELIELEKFNPETRIPELGTAKSSGLCVQYY